MGDLLTEDSFIALGYFVGINTDESSIYTDMGYSCEYCTRRILDKQNNKVGDYVPQLGLFLTPVFYRFRRDKLNRRTTEKEDDTVEKALDIILKDEGLAVAKKWDDIYVAKSGLVIKTDNKDNVKKALSMYEILNSDTIEVKMRKHASMALRDAEKTAAAMICKILK